MFGSLRCWLCFFGLDEIRCASCLHPFSPSAPEAATDAVLPLCTECRPLLAPYTGQRCRQCGFPFPWHGSANGTTAPVLCGVCLNEAPSWRKLAYHGLYRGALRDLILRFKFGGELSLAPLLGLWLENVAACLPAPDALLGMPQHPAHLRRRGFNQAHELARALHATTRIPLRPDLLVRKHDSAPQASLNAKQRAENVRGVFGVAAPAHGLRIWLIDDVMTTGSTLREATRTLLDAGAKEVCVLALARTPRMAV